MIKKIVTAIIGIIILIFLFRLFNTPTFVVQNNESNEIKEELTLKDSTVLVSESKENLTNSSSSNHDDYDNQLNDLPTNEDLRNVTIEEVHHTPEVISKGGELVGRIHEEAHFDLSKRQSAMNFFKACAEDAGIVAAVRAVCLSKIYQLIPEWQIPVIVDEAKVTKDIIDLSMEL